MNDTPEKKDAAIVNTAPVTKEEVTPAATPKSQPMYACKPEVLPEILTRLNKAEYGVARPIIELIEKNFIQVSVILNS